MPCIPYCVLLELSNRIKSNIVDDASNDSFLLKFASCIIKRYNLITLPGDASKLFRRRALPILQSRIEISTAAKL